VECLTNWLNFGLSGVSLSKLENEYKAILDFVFDIDEENMETYSSCICVLLKLPLQNNQLNYISTAILNKVIAFKDR
jgi:hypothetical protein